MTTIEIGSLSLAIQPRAGSNEAFVAEMVMDEERADVEQVLP